MHFCLSAPGSSVVQCDFELQILLSPPTQSWDCRPVLSCPARKNVVLKEKEVVHFRVLAELSRLAVLIKNFVWKISLFLQKIG